MSCDSAQTDQLASSLIAGTLRSHDRVFHSLIPQVAPLIRSPSAPHPGASPLIPAATLHALTPRMLSRSYAYEPNRTLTTEKKK